jgi:CubicO group peptidase (beta-lactamase class C family)
MTVMKKLVLRTIFILIIISVIYLLYNYRSLKRVYRSITLFDKENIVQNFQNMSDIVDVSILEPSSHPYQWSQRLDYIPIDSFYYEDSLFIFDDYIEHTLTEGLMIVHNDTIVYEQYYNDLQPEETHISWSMSKSFVATMMGQLYDQGYYKLLDPVTKYLPELSNTGYDNVPIKDILQMSSGVRYDEDYSDFNSDINRFGRSFAAGSPLIDFVRSLEREREPGTYNHYVSMDTQVLGFLIAKLTGQSVTEYMQEHIWDPMGMEYSGEWIVDNTGVEMVLGGLNAALRDYAKLGLLYLHEGEFNGQKILSKDWVRMATTPDAQHLMPDQTTLSSNHHGYGFQWWIPQYDRGDFMAGGIYNQYIYVQPDKNLVITKLSANYHYKTQKHITKDIHIAMFQKMAEAF